MTRAPAAFLLSLSSMLAAPAAMAQEKSFDLPAGPLGVAGDALSRQGGISIVLSDPTLWNLRVSALRGRMSTSQAVKRLAEDAGVNAVKLNGTGWRLTKVVERSAVKPSKPRGTLRAPYTPESDVVVLASKRETPYEAFAGTVETIRVPRLGIDAGTQSLVTRSTIISSTYRGAGREKLFLRGLSDSGFSGRLQSVTGLYFGDVRLTYSASDPDLQLYDVESVEVLQGPQGTLYGSGSLAGIIRMNPVTPKRGRSEALIGAGSSATRHGSTGADLNVMANVPLSRSSTIRVVGYVREEPGYIDKPAVGRDVNRARVEGARATARWWIADGWTADLTGMLQAGRSADNQYATIGAPRLTADVGAVTEPYASNYAAAHLVVAGPVSGLQLTSATGFATQRFDERFELPLLPGVVRRSDTHRRHRMMTHETRLGQGGSGGTGWVAGFSYTEPTSDSAYRETLVLPEASSDGEVFGVRSAVSEFALFGEGSIRLTPLLTLGAGARAVQATTRTRLAASVDIDAGARRRERWILPTASVLLSPAHNLSLYFRYQQGARPSTPPLRALGFLNETPRERVSTIEAGLRWRSDGGWATTASVLRTRWRQLQIDNLEAFYGFVTGDLADWRITSTNVAVSGPVLPGLRVTAAATMNKNERTGSFPGGTDVGLTDIADLIARADVEWTRPLGPAATFKLSISARYEGASRASVTTHDGQRQGDYVRAAFTLEVDRDFDSVSLSMDNLLDSTANRYTLVAIARFGTTATPLRPLTGRIGYERRF